MTDRPQLVAQEWDPLHLAASRNDVTSIRTLMRGRWRRQRSRDNKGQTPLHVAARNGHYEAVRALVEEGAAAGILDINAQDDAGDTPLHIATRNKASPIFNLLVHHPKCSPDVQNRAGDTAFHVAMSSKNEEVHLIAPNLKRFSVDVFNGEGHSPFHVAIKNHKHDVVGTFVDEMPRLKDQLTSDGEPPLWLTVRYLDLRVMTLLLEKGADVNCQHKFIKSSALWLAIYNQFDKGADLLLGREDLDPTTIDKPAFDGTSPLLLAMIMGHGGELVNKLMSRSCFGVERECGVVAKKVLLDLANAKDFEIFRNKEEVCNYVDREGNNLLHLAVLSDSVAMVGFVVFLYTTVGILQLKMEEVNGGGISPVDLALSRRQSGITDIFKSQNVNGEEEEDNFGGPDFEVSREIPKFSDDLEDMFEELRDANLQEEFHVTPDSSGCIEFQALEQLVIPKLAVDWTRPSSIGNDESGFPKHIPTLQSATLYRKESSDDDNTRMIKSFLEVLALMETYLRREDELFRHLRVSLMPVGGTVEGTKVGRLNELDSMFFCAELHGHLHVEDVQTICITPDKYDSLDDKVKILFCASTRRLKMATFFTKFLHSIRNAANYVQERVTISQEIKMYLETEACTEDACRKKSEVWKQCCHRVPPCVCYTAVGAGLNFVWKGRTNHNMVFTVDVVPNFYVHLDGWTNFTLRQGLIRLLLEKRPFGWCHFLKKYVRDDRIYSGQYDLEETSVACVGLKMLNGRGDFAIRPGLNMKVEAMLEEDVVRRSYSLLKVLKTLTVTKLKSFDLKKAVSEARRRRSSLGAEEKPDDVSTFTKKVLDSPDIKHKLECELIRILNGKYSKFDLTHFPVVMHGMVPAVKLMARDALELKNLIVTGDLLDFAEKLRASPGKEEELVAETVRGRSLLHYAALMWQPDAARELVSLGSDLNLRDPDGNTPLQCTMLNRELSSLRRRTDLMDRRLYGTLEQLLRDGGSGNFNFGTQNEREETIFHMLARSQLKQEVYDLVLEKPAATADKDVLNLRDRRGFTPLFIACLTGNHVFSSSILKHGPDVDLPDLSDNAPLHVASREGFEDVVALLLHHGADVNGRNRQGYTPLHLASVEGRERIVELLLHNGADASVTNNLGDTAASCACDMGHCSVLLFLLDHDPVDMGGLTRLLSAPCQLGHSAVAKLLVDRGADVKSTAHTTMGATQLHVASLNGHLEVVRVLLEGGAEVNRVDRHYGATALVVASQNGHAEVAACLVSHGADVRLRTTVGETPLHISCHHGHPGMARLLISRGADVNDVNEEDGLTPLSVACLNGHLDVVKVLLESNAEMDTPHPTDGVTSLYMASQNGHSDVVQLMLESGASVDSEISEPINIASEKGHLEVVRLLIAYKADVNKASKDLLRTPLYMASQFGRTEVAKLLIGHKAEVNLVAEDEVTPLSTACQGGHYEVARLLIQNGADVKKASNTDGKTPLYNACRDGHTEIVRLLLDHGAPVNGSAMLNGITPLLIASQNGHAEIVRMLLRGNADINQAFPENGWTPLVAAARFGHAEVVRLLLDKQAGMDGSLQAACQSGSLDVMKMLVSNGAMHDSSHVEMSGLSSDIVEYLRGARHERMMREAERFFSGN